MTNNQNAARILVALAAENPSYEALAAEYTEALSGAADLALPDGFAAQTLELLRADAAMAERIGRIERSLSQTQSFGASEVQTLLLLVSVLIVLLRPHVDFKTSWDLKFLKGSLTFDTAVVDEKALKAVQSVLSSVAKKLSKGLDDVSKALDGQDDGAGNSE